MFSISCVSDEDLDDFNYVSGVLPLLHHVQTYTTRKMAESLPSQNQATAAAKMAEWNRCGGPEAIKLGTDLLADMEDFLEVNRRKKKRRRGNKESKRAKTAGLLNFLSSL